MTYDNIYIEIFCWHRDRDKVPKRMSVTTRWPAQLATAQNMQCVVNTSIIFITFVSKHTGFVTSISQL